METSVENISPESSQPRLLEIDYVRQMLSTTSKWTKFLGIMGFIACGFMVMAALGMMALGSSFSNLEGMPYSSFISGGMMGGIYLLMTLLYFFPSRYLYQFSDKLNQALQSEDETQLILALDKNKSFFKFIGITTVVVIGLYLLMFIAMVAGVAMGGDFITQ